MNTRCFARLALLAAVATAPAHANTNYAFRVAADRAGAIYRQGEPVTFTIELALDRKPVADVDIAWSLTKDGLPPITNGHVRLAAGRASVTGHLAEPGFLQCRATFQDADRSNHVALGGAAIDPLLIRPGMPAPADFDAFWTAQKKALAAIPANPRLTPVPSTAKDLECFDLQADSVGAPVSGYFARPAKATPKSLPAILLVHGAGVRSSVLVSATGWAQKGMLALDINAHGLPNGRPEQFYKDLSEGDLKDYRTRGRESRDTIYFRGMFLRLVRAIDVLTAQPEWDGRTVIVHGTSQGGAQSLVAAGLDPRVTFFAAGVPALCDHNGYAAGRINGWPKFIATGETPPPNVAEAVRYYDAANFVARTRAPGIVTVGFIDTTCPPSSVYAAYNSIPTRKEIFNDVPSGHANSPQAGEAMRAAILAHVAAMKRPASP